MTASSFFIAGPFLCEASSVSKKEAGKAGSSPYAAKVSVNRRVYRCAIVALHDRRATSLDGGGAGSKRRAYDISRPACTNSCKFDKQWQTHVEELKLKGISILLVLFVSVGAISPQLYPSLINPPRVRFTGVLLPNKTQAEGFAGRSEVFIGNEKSTFVLDKMKIVGSVGLNRLPSTPLSSCNTFCCPDDLMRRLKTQRSWVRLSQLRVCSTRNRRMLFLTEWNDGEEDGTN